MGLDLRITWGMHVSRLEHQPCLSGNVNGCATNHLGFSRATSRYSGDKSNESNQLDDLDFSGDISLFHRLASWMCPTQSSLWRRNLFCCKTSACKAKICCRFIMFYWPAESDFAKKSLQHHCFWLFSMLYPLIHSGKFGIHLTHVNSARRDWFIEFINPKTKPVLFFLPISSLFKTWERTKIPFEKIFVTKISTK